MNNKKNKEQYYVCDKKEGGTWFTCNTYIEAVEWISIAPFKANMASSKFYIRKQKIRTKRSYPHDNNGSYNMENY